MNVHIFQHVDFEGPGIMRDWLLAKKHRLTSTYFFEEKHALPPIHEIDALIIMGGPMNVYEEAKYPWLINEKRFIREMIEAGKPVLGICLGAQLIAVAQGAGVFENGEQEIGWLPVYWHDTMSEWLNAPLSKEQFYFHWHGDTFHLPPNAVLQCSTPACRNQLFTIGDKVAGIQFHPEVRREDIENMYSHSGTITSTGKYIQATAQPVKEEHLLKAHGTMELILNKLFT